MNTNTKKKVVLVVAYTDYQPLEYGATHQVLASNTIEVYTASDKAGMATAQDGSTTQINSKLEDINPIDYDGIFLIGGKGAMEHLDNAIMYTLLQQMKALHKAYGAICIAPRILAKAEVLGGKSATGWDKDGLLQEIFDTHGVNYNKYDAVVVDGSLVTANGPDAAIDFGAAIVRVLQTQKP
jgi:protease I